MADDNTKETEESPATLSLGELKKLIESVAGSLFKDVSTTEKDAREGAGKYQQEHLSRRSDIADDVEKRVREELTRMHEQENRNTRDKDVDAMLKAWRENATKSEKPPIERRRVHRVMGWGEPSE